MHEGPLMTPAEFALEIARWEANHLALVMQCAYIEAHWGAGAEAAVRWIDNQLEDTVPPVDFTDADSWWEQHYQPCPDPTELGVQS